MCANYMQISLGMPKFPKVSLGMAKFSLHTDGQTKISVPGGGQTRCSKSKCLHTPGPLILELGLLARKKEMTASKLLETRKFARQPDTAGGVPAPRARPFACISLGGRCR